MFLGPARVLATESKRNDKGELAAGSSIWCVRGRRLIKRCPEQLRRASSREELLEHIADPQNEDAPWNFPRVAAELGGNEYWDISQDVPAEEDWEMAQDPVIAPQPSRGHSTKRAETISHNLRSSRGKQRGRSRLRRGRCRIGSAVCGVCANGVGGKGGAVGENSTIVTGK